jgi:hypothetical protein
MKKNQNKDFGLANSAIMIAGAVIVLIGVAIIANLSPVNEWTKFHEFLKSYGANASLIVGGVSSLLGLILIFVSLKTNK